MRTIDIAETTSRRDGDGRTNDMKTKLSSSSAAETTRDRISLQNRRPRNRRTTDNSAKYRDQLNFIADSEQLVGQPANQNAANESKMSPIYQTFCVVVIA